MRRHSQLSALIALLFACMAVPGISASEHHGVVQSGGLPVPGATVSAIQGDKKIVTTTDDQGGYSFPNLADGVWTIEVDMFGFAKLSREVGIAPEAPSPTWQLQVLSLSALSAPPPAPARAPAVTPPAGGPPPGGPPARRGGFGRGGAGPRDAQGAPASLRQALAQNGFQQANVNASADGSGLQVENLQNGGETFGDLNQSASDSLVVNGSVSGGLGLPQQNDWFAFGRGFDNGFGPGFGPGGPGGPGAAGGADGGGALAAAGTAPAAGQGGPGAAGPGGGPGGRGGGGFGGGGFPGGFGGGRGGRGGFGRGGRGPRNLNAFGNGRRNRRQQYNGNIALILDNSALDARPYSLTGQDTPKAAYAQFRTTGIIGGPLKIPHLLSGQNTFFSLNYQLSRGRNANTLSGLMPTPEQRATVTDPQALALLNANYFPLPNLIGNPRYNYQISALTVTNQNNVNVRVSHTINSKNQISGNFAWQNSDVQTPNIFQFLDTTATTGYNTGLNYTYHFTTRLISNLRYGFSRQAADQTPYFSNRQDVAGDAGIQKTERNPLFWGPPTLTFADGISSLTDGNYARNHNTTQQVGESLLWVRGAHNFTFGGDFRRLDFNQFSQQNPRGSFLFSSFTGSSLGDFAVGQPLQSSIAYGNADKYFRTSWMDAFVNDDWRLNSKLSINAGLRWDFQAPVSELYNRLVNLQIGPGFTTATPVCAADKPGCVLLAGQTGLPNSLVNPNYLQFQPRIGVAWRPFTKDSTVVRAGYGLYYNTSVYQSLVSQMAQQSPLSYSVTQQNCNPAQQSCGIQPFTMANAFTYPAIGVTPQTYALDPNFQLGYLHYWQLSIQHNLPASLVATVTYNGNKGTHQIQQFLPNTYPAGDGTSAAPSGYVYVTSGGNSNYNAISGQLQRRFRSGLAGNIIYTFSRAIDDAQSLGGRGAVAGFCTATVCAQNWMDLAAERSLSSFNRTHTLNMNLQWSTGQGAAGGGLLSGWKGALAKDWTFTTAIVLGSGLPETPLVLNNVARGTGITGTVRAEYLGGSLTPEAAGYGFNPLAFGPAPSGQWGDAGRNIISGPMQFSLNAAAGRVFRIAERRSIELRFNSTNVLNHVSFTSWDTTFGTPQFGLPVNTGQMRTMQAILRFRF